MKLERRFFELQKLETRADEEGNRTISGYAAVFNSLSQMLWGFRERIAPGAFAETLGDDIRALWNHDSNIVLGRTIAGTLRLEEDDHGLRVEIDAPRSAAQQVEAIERGDVNQMSFGFRALDFEWDEDDEGTLIRTLNKAKLYEVSPVTFPAYTSTSVGVRNDEVYGVIPEIPEEFRRASGSSADADHARARLDVQRRRLDLLAMR
ncbi:MAG: HK97 family phage prohead protease [Chloroflexota bacterium]